MAATAELIQVKAMQEMVRPLGIELPKSLPDYAKRSDEEVYDEFATQIDRLLPDSVQEEQGELSNGEISLSIGSYLGVREVPGEIGDIDEAWSGSDDKTLGPSRWLKLIAPLRISGVRVDEIVTTGVMLDISEEYDGLFDRRPADSDLVRSEMSVSTLWTPPTATPTEAAFGLRPNLAFNDDLNPNETGREDQELWRVWAEKSGNLAEDRLDWAKGLNRNTVFGIGVEVLKRVDPKMLVTN